MRDIRYPIHYTPEPFTWRRFLRELIAFVWVGAWLLAAFVFVIAIASVE